MPMGGWGGQLVEGLFIKKNSFLSASLTKNKRPLSFFSSQCFNQSYLEVLLGKHLIQDVLAMKKDLEEIFNTHPHSLQQRKNLAMQLSAFGFTETIDNCGWVGSLVILSNSTGLLLVHWPSAYG